MTVTTHSAGSHFERTSLLKRYQSPMAALRSAVRGDTRSQYSSCAAWLPSFTSSEPAAAALYGSITLRPCRPRRREEIKSCQLDGMLFSLPVSKTSAGAHTVPDPVQWQQIGHSYRARTCAMS